MKVRAYDGPERRRNGGTPPWMIVLTAASICVAIFAAGGAVAEKYGWDSYVQNQKDLFANVAEMHRDLESAKVQWALDIGSIKSDLTSDRQLLVAISGKLDRHMEAAH